MAEPQKIYSWEDFKVEYGLQDITGSELPIEAIKFRFEYTDDAKRTHVISYDGETRVNNVIRDGKLLGLFPRDTFVKGKLTVRRAYWQQDPDFADERWVYGTEEKTNITII